MQQPFEKLLAWRQAHDLCLRMYTLTRQFPAEEKFGLVSQMRRAAYSVPMNIVEGNARRFPKDKARFMEIALGSLGELQYQCLLARDLEYFTEERLFELQEKTRSISYLLTRLRNSFR